MSHYSTSSRLNPAGSLPRLPRRQGANRSLRATEEKSSGNSNTSKAADEMIERKNSSSCSRSREARSQEEMKSSDSGSCQPSSAASLPSGAGTAPSSPFCELCFLFWNI